MAQRKQPEELSKDEIEEQNGEELPDREVMSVIAVDPEPFPVSHPEGPAENPETDPGDPAQ